MPDRLTPADVAQFAAATHKLSRLLAKDPVTSPLRVPFATYKETQGPAELLEEVRGQDARKAVGELVTCPFCIGLWAATGFTAQALRRASHQAFQAAPQQEPAGRDYPRPCDAAAWVCPGAWPAR